MTTLPSTVARRVGEGIGPEPSEAGCRLAKEGKLGEDKTVLALLRRRNNATVVERVAGYFTIKPFGATETAHCCVACARFGGFICPQISV